MNESKWAMKIQSTVLYTSQKISYEKKKLINNFACIGTKHPIISRVTLYFCQVFDQNLMS